MNELGPEAYTRKALESLAGASSELAHGRYNNCANRCYYSCFQAAIAALLRESIRPAGERWEHGFVQAQFIGILINRRKRFPPAVHGTLERNYALRVVGDYQEQSVSERQASRATQRAQEFVTTVLGGDSI